MIISYNKQLFFNKGHVSSTPVYSGVPIAQSLVFLCNVL